MCNIYMHIYMYLSSTSKEKQVRMWVLKGQGEEVFICNICIHINTYIHMSTTSEET